MEKDETPSIAKELATVFAVNTAAYAGALIGVGIVFVAVGKIAEKMENRRNKK